MKRLLAQVEGAEWLVCELSSKTKMSLELQYDEIQLVNVNWTRELFHLIGMKAE